MRRPPTHWTLPCPLSLYSTHALRDHTTTTTSAATHPSRLISSNITPPLGTHRAVHSLVLIQSPPPTPYLPLTSPHSPPSPPSPHLTSPTHVRRLCSTLRECESPRPCTCPAHAFPRSRPPQTRSDRTSRSLTWPPCHLQTPQHPRPFACFEAFLFRVSSDPYPFSRHRPSQPTTSRFAKQHLAETTRLDIHVYARDT